MKHFKIITSMLGLATTLLFAASCTKQTPSVADTVTDLSNNAQIQVFNGTQSAARNYVYVDNIPVSGAAFAYGGVFPATPYSFTVVHGARTITIRDTLLTTTQTPIVFSKDFEAGKSYTIFTYGLATNAQQQTVENNIVIPKDTTARLRFANFIYSATAVPAVDVYSVKRGMGTPVFTNVAVNTVTDFIPYASNIVDSLLVYPTGTTSPLLIKAIVVTGVPTATRSYTACFNGNYSAPKVTSFATY
jgi:hypothetical protein